MTSKLNPEKIRHILNQGTQQLDEATLSALQQARAKAMQRQAMPVRGLRLAGHRALGALVPHSTQQWLAAIVLGVVLVAGSGWAWQQYLHQQSIDLDMDMLTDELPLELFVD